MNYHSPKKKLSWIIKYEYKTNLTFHFQLKLQDQNRLPIQELQ